MDKDEIEKEVTSWWWNLSQLEIYDRLREALDYYWHCEDCSREDVGKMIALADIETAKHSHDHFWTELAEHLDNSFEGVKEAYDTALESHEKLEVVK